MVDGHGGRPFFIIPHNRRNAFSRYDLHGIAIGGDAQPAFFGVRDMLV